jgi:type IV pilus assembly protein PilY1
MNGAWLRGFGRDALIALVCVTHVWPAWAQTSTLAQSPPYMATEPASNVFLMLDDSNSMSAHQLPRPSGITLVAGLGTTVTVTGEGADWSGTWATRSWNINRDFDWLVRSPALNPLWYNPSIRYRPWNKDGVPMPNASIGGSTSPAHWGQFGARPVPGQLTERDPRQVRKGANYVSLTNLAGRGLLGTDPGAPTANLTQGRLVSASSPEVAFRYAQLPFEFGPAQPGATAPPGNGHASQLWDTHHDRDRPLDLFSRPVGTPPTPTRTGCFGSSALCLSGASPSPLISQTNWKRLDCDGVERTYTSDPGPVTCHRSRCDGSGWGAWSTTPTTPACGFGWTNCAGAWVTSPTNPGPVSCPWRRFDCSGTLQNFGSDPGPSTCYRTRGCPGGWSAWSQTNPGTPTACWQRTSCSGATEYFSGANPGSLSCSWTRQDCSGTTQTFTSDPGTLTCWSRQDCSGATQQFTSNPGPLICGYRQLQCNGVNQSFPTSPPALTCYRRQECNGVWGAWSTANPGSLSCATSGELPVIYNPVSETRNATTDSRSPTSSTRWPSGGGPRDPIAYSRVESAPGNSALPPSTSTPTPIASFQETSTRTAVQQITSVCPAGTSWLSCTPPASPDVPNPEALTPARYYRYTGSGSKGDPANYRVVQIDRTRPSSVMYPVVDAATGQTVSASQSRRTDCAALTQCTWVEEAQNFANWWLYYRNRLFAAQAVMADALSNMNRASEQRLRVGFGRINNVTGAIDPWRTHTLTPNPAPAPIDGVDNPGALVRGVRPFTVGSPARAEVFDWLFSLAWANPTPNREAIDSMGRYFTRTDNRGPWGATPGTDDPTPQMACRRNFALLTTDGEWTKVPGQVLISGTGPLPGPGTPLEADNTNGPTITGSGPNSGASFTYRPSSWPQFTGGTAQSGTLTDAAVYYWNRDLRPDLANVISPMTTNPAFWQSMSTYVIGYGILASMDTPDTRARVAAGTTVNWPAVNDNAMVVEDPNRINDSMRAALASRGGFYAANDVDQLALSIRSSFADIVSKVGSAGGVAVTGPVVVGDSLVFYPSYRTGTWSGSLGAYDSAGIAALARGDTVTPAWMATVPEPGTRNVITSTAPRTGANFLAGSLSAAQRSALESTGHPADRIVSYLRGDRSREIGGTGPAAEQAFRKRESLIGALVNSGPVYVKAPDYGYAAMPDHGVSYTAYVTARRARQADATVFVGGNAGVFHAFNANTGVERFAYVPRGAYPNLAQLADPNYEQRYYVDGPVVAGDFHDGGRWRSAVVGTTGAGGGSIFAIDVTDPAAVGPGQVMWDLTKDADQHVGHVLSRGVIGRIRTGPTGPDRWVYIAGNGYESASNRAALLVVGLLDGAVTSIPVGSAYNPALGLQARNGMGGVTVRYDGARRIVGVYAGDRQGNLWRFDFSNGVPSTASGFGGSAEPLFTAQDPVSLTPRPITAAPRLMRHPRGGLQIVFGTGKLYDVGDGANVAPQAIYGIWEKPERATRISTGNLATVSFTAAPGGNRAFDLSGIDWSTRLGWTVPLPAGERVISDPATELGMLSISTFVPESVAESCEGGGKSWMYRLNASTGTAIGTPIGGTVGASVPLARMPDMARTLSTIQPSTVLTRQFVGVGGGGGSPSECRVLTASIQGRPNQIAQQCTGLAPVRVWRQPMR